MINLDRSLPMVVPQPLRPRQIELWTQFLDRIWTPTVGPILDQHGLTLQEKKAVVERCLKDPLFFFNLIASHERKRTQNGQENPRS